MKKFWSTFFASLLAFVVGSIILQCIALFMFIAFIGLSISSSSAKSSTQLERGSVLKLEFVQLPEKSQHVNLGFYSDDDKVIPLTDMVRAIDRAKDNPYVEGIYIHCPMPATGLASLRELREAIATFQASGKWVVAYADSYSQQGYYLSSVAEDLYINPQGSLDLKGLASSSLFYRNTLRKLGVEMQIFKVGTYKGAVEPYLLDSYSKANQEQIVSYLNGLWSEIRGKIAASREIAPTTLDSIVNQAPTLFNPTQYSELALVDELLYEREVMARMRHRLGLDEDDDIEFVTASDVLRAKRPGHFKDREGAIMVCYAEGVINSSKVSNPYASNAITEKLASELIEYAEDDDIDAVVMRVNSPGGSAYVSDQIWDAVSYLKSKKPVVVSMGNYAASGGYYISCASNYIVADPVTITGSIGIYGMIPNLAGVANKLELKHDVVKTHRHSDAFSNPFRPFNSEENAMMQAYIERGYDTFISRVAEGRNLSKAMVDSVGQGRVWTGVQALERNLVDEIGGLQEAVKKAAQLAGLKDGYRVTYKTRDYIDFKNFYDKFLMDVGEKVLTRFLTQEEIEAIKHSRSIRSLEGVQALLPYEVAI